MWLILWIIGGLICLRALYCCIRNTIEDIQKIRRCTVPITADILSWRIEEDSDNPTQCLPRICYSYQDQMYETDFWDGMVTLYQKEHYYNGNTLSIFVNPEDPADITPGNKGRSVWRSIESFVMCVLLFLFLLLICIVGVYSNL